MFEMNIRLGMFADKMRVCGVFETSSGIDIMGLVIIKAMSYINMTN